MTEEIINQAKQEGNVNKLKEIAVEAFKAGKDDIEEFANAAILEIENATKQAEEVSESEKSMIGNQGGTQEEAEIRTKSVEVRAEEIEKKAEEEIKEVETTNAENPKTEEVKEVETPSSAEVFNSTEMIREMTGGSDKLERYGRGYDSALNMYASSLTNKEDLEKYKDIFSQLAPEDKAKMEEGVVGQEIKNAMLNSSVPEVKAKFAQDMENYSQMFPTSVENAKMYSTMTTPNFDPKKFQEMYDVSEQQLFRILQGAKDKMIEDIRKEQNVKIHDLTLTYQELINKAPSEKTNLEKNLQWKVNEITNASEISVTRINEEYNERSKKISS